VRTAELTDRDLAIQFGQKGDPKAFAELVARWDQRVFAFLWKAAGDPEAANDLRQDVFVRLYCYGHTYKPEYAFSTWLFQIVRNVSKTWQSRQNRLRTLEEPAANQPDIAEAADVSSNPFDCAVRTERQDRLSAAIGRLSVVEKELLLLRFNAGLTYREIAKVFGDPETTIKSRLYAVLGRIRKALRDEDVPERSHE